MKEIERSLLKNIRDNSRQSIAKLSRRSNTSPATLYAVLRRLDSKLITKHVAIIDFSKLGFNIRVNILFNVLNEEFSKKLEKLEQINSLYKVIGNDNSYLADCLFKDLKEFSEFKEEILHKQGAIISEIFLIETLKQENLSL